MHTPRHRIERPGARGCATTTTGEEWRQYMRFCETNRIGLEAKIRVNLLMMNQMQHSAEEKRIRFVWRENDITAFQVGGSTASFSVCRFQCHSDGSRLDTFQASNPTN